MGRLANDPIAIQRARQERDEARRNADVYPLANVLARPNERGDAHLSLIETPQPWRSVLIVLLIAVGGYLALIGLAAVLGGWR